MAVDEQTTDFLLSQMTPVECHEQKPVRNLIKTEEFIKISDSENLQDNC
jgi:hypothetical protein